METLEPAERYGVLASDGWHDRVEDKDLLIAMFIQAMRNIYGKAFNGVLTELHALLSDPPLEAIYYPRTSETPTEEGENFKWFVGNTRKHGPHIPLALAPQDEGLPVLKPFISSSVKVKESHEAAKPLPYFARSHKLTAQYEELFDTIDSR